MKHGAPIVFILAAFLPVAARPALPDTAYAILQTIKTPQELVGGVLPSSYCASLALEGSLASEMEAALTGLGLPAPQYEEVFDKGRFTLRLANSAYTVPTRDLLSGI
jgi:hypothetical protein